MLVSLRRAAATFALLISSASHVGAAEQVIALDYSAPPSCPSAVELQNQIRGFVPAVGFAPRADLARVFEISIDQDGTFGQLRLLGEQEAGSRVAKGADCAEVARLLAFAVALVLDPQLQMDVPAAPATMNPAASAPPLDFATLPRPLPALVLPASPASDAPSGSAPQRGRSANQSIAVVGSLANATSPNLSYGVGALYGLVTAIGSLEPQIRLGASYSQSADASREGALVAFSAFLGAVEGCPRPLRLGQLELWPCLRVDLGARRASASDIPGAKARVRPWLSVDALVDARFRLAWPLFVELSGGAMFPILHDRVFLQPNFTVHRVPYVGFLGQMGVGIEFGDRNRN